MLNNNGSFILSYTANPTASDIANQYKALSLKVKYLSRRTDDSAETDDGTMHIDWIVSKRRQIEIELPPLKCNLDGGNVLRLLNMVQGNKYYITYYDFVAGAEKTIYVYTDASNAEMYNGVLYNGIISGVSFIATEIKGDS